MTICPVTQVRCNRECEAGCALRPYPYPDDKRKTHFHECWRERGHHNCAVAEVERLRLLEGALRRLMASGDDRGG